MGKTRTADRRVAHKLAAKQAKRRNLDNGRYDPEAANTLLEETQYSFSSGNLETALQSAQKALKFLTPSTASTPCLEQLPALEVLGAIYIELGDPESAQTSFGRAAQVDPTGQYAGAEKFLWLAQLSEEGGRDTIQWFEKGIRCLRDQSQQAQENSTTDRNELDSAGLDEIREKLSSALCGAAEVYMTDLSFEDDCEAECEALVTEAVKIAPESPSVLQTLANVRISQQRIEEARDALERSISIWEPRLRSDHTENTNLDMAPGQEEPDDDIPDFATRISLCRLLMEVDMCQRALSVLDRLVLEDDRSVEAWYLGGWCQRLLADAGGEAQPRNSADDEVSRDYLKGSVRWLRRCLEEYRKQDYEDDRLQTHAVELLNEVSGKVEAEEDEDDNEDAWEEQEGDDEDMLNT